MLRRRTKEVWTETHRNVARKMVLDGRWVQKRLFDIGWSDEGKRQGCCEEEGTEMKEQLSKAVMQGRRFAADAARITDVSAGSEDGKHTSGEVFVAIDCDLEKVIDKEEGAVMAILCRNVWHSERWARRNEGLMEAVVKQARVKKAASKC